MLTIYLSLRNVGKPVVGRVTNNVGEIQAAIYAIKTAKRLGITKLCLSTDSQFLINSITLWIKGWKAKNWRLKNGEPVKNVVEFKELDALLQDKSIEIKWVNLYAYVYQLHLYNIRLFIFIELRKGS